MKRDKYLIIYCGISPNFFKAETRVGCTNEASSPKTDFPCKMECRDEENLLLNKQGTNTVPKRVN
jgi:hypothetical protein